MFDRPGGIGRGDGVPLVTRLLLLRAAVHVDLSPSASPIPSAREAALMLPTLRIVSHFAQETPSASASPLRPLTTTPEEEAQFLEAYPSLHGLLSSLAAERLAQRVRLRQLQTSVVRTSVKLTRAAAASASAEDTPALRSSSNSSNDVDYSQLQGVVAAATASFAEDAACCSTITPHSPQLNPWCFLPVSAEGCYVTVPSPPFVQWCRTQAVRCCDGVGTASPTEPKFCGGPMRYTDIVHYASATRSPSSRALSANAAAAALGPGDGEDSGYMHGYTFMLEGDVFTGSGRGGEAAAVAAAVASMDRQLSEASLRDNGGEEASILMWCVLSDAPVYNFMRALTHEAVSAMSYVAQRVYNERVGSTVASSASAPLAPGVYTALLDDALQEEVVRPLAKELLTCGSVSSRTLPGDAFTVQLALQRSSEDGGGRGGPTASRSLTSPAPSLLTFRRPLDMLYPHADVPLAPLLLSFNEDALHVLQSLLMQEARVVVLGATPQHASACVVSLPALLSPLTWVSPLVPYLPPHLAAVTGLLQTLLRRPFEQRRRHAPSGKPPAQLLASHRVESTGFLVGSTAAIQPYLLLLSSSSRVEAGMGANDRGGGEERATRVWIADARTGCIGVCPEEPVARFSRADSLPSANSSDGSAETAAAASTALGAWATPAHVDLRQIAPHCCERDGSRSDAALYGAARNRLRAATESNVMDAAPLDLLPAFSDDLRHLLRRVVSVDKRRLFRHCLEAMAQHTQARLEGLESLAARLTRGLRLETGAASIGRSLSTDSTFHDVLESRSSCSGAEEWDEELTENHASEGGIAALRATTVTLTQSFSKSFASAAASSAMSFAATTAPQFPVLPPHELWQLQVEWFDYMVRRFTGAYRRGLTTTMTAAGGGLGSRSSSAGGSGQCRAPTIESSLFLVPGMDQRHALAKRVSQTHLFKQFECAVLAAEIVGLRRVLSRSADARAGGAQPLHSCDGGAEVHPLLANVRSLALFALWLSRARLHYAELYTDLASVDAVGLVHTAMVMRWFAKRPGSSALVSVPGAIQLLAGGYSDSGAGEEAEAATTRAAYRGRGPDAHGGGGGALRGLLSKVAKKVKDSLNSDGGGRGRARGVEAVYLPAAVACLHTFRAPPFSQLPKAPTLSAIPTYAKDPLTKRRGDAASSTSGRCGRHVRRRHRTAAQAPLSGYASLPPRAEWARQQEQQRRIALDTEFTLQDCVNVVQAAGPGGGGGGSGGGGYDVSGVGVYGGGSAYVSGLGLTSATPDAIARTGGDAKDGRANVGMSASAQQRDAYMRAASEASLYICHALPLDIVHEFSAYEPLLCPVPPGRAQSSSAGTSGDALEVGSAAAYLRVGSLCPTYASVWCEGEARMMGASVEQPHPRPTKTSTSAAASPASSAQSQPQPPRVAYPVPPPLWGAFTSGVPQDYPSATPAAPNGRRDGDAPLHQAVSACASTPASLLWSNATGPLAVHSASDSPSLHGSATLVTGTNGSGTWSGGGGWSSGAPPMMMLEATEALPPHRGFAPSSTATAVAAPDPRTLMDDLFAGMPTHPAVDTATAERGSQRQPSTEAAHRPLTLDDFF
ncbi:hypothetical protein LSCM1_07446 [Leishmania martiniquensis]|uniref:cDENN domain-containing protein n=1 Tax=Leishmania martiniquensis TaxID=1580590 RepID=A0A836KUH9_9TRYP|nr:hypothetical protein LSCM1_07446 [Leishmania martiniquensis]